MSFWKRLAKGKTWEDRLTDWFEKNYYWVDKHYAYGDYGTTNQRYYTKHGDKKIHPDLIVEYNDGGCLVSRLVEVKYQDVLYQNYRFLDKRRFPKNKKYFYVSKDQFDSYMDVSEDKDLDWDIYFAVYVKDDVYSWYYADGNYLDGEKKFCENIFGDGGEFYLFEKPNFFHLGIFEYK